MKFVIHKSNTRGHADHGWLQSYHTFSFAGYHNPSRMNFGALRVLNDDEVAPGRGFGTHPHDNMEIVSIPLAGDLEHKDSMGNTTIIKNGDVQVMSAGTGVYHSEYNKNKDQEVKFLQIWMFPNKRNVEPRYDQMTLNKEEMKNNFQQIVSPYPEDQGVWVHQDAWFNIGEFEKNSTITYDVHRKENGVYVFLLEGAVKINGHSLTRRDGMGIWEVAKLDISAMEQSKILLMEVPMLVD